MHGAEEFLTYPRLSGDGASVFNVSSERPIVIYGIPNSQNEIPDVW